MRSLLLLALLAPIAWFYVEALGAPPGHAPDLSGQVLRLLAPTIRVAGGATALAMLLGLAAAITAERYSAGWRPLFLALCATPLLIPSAIITGAWLGLCGSTPPVGWIVRLWVACGGDPQQPSALLHSEWGAALVGGSIAWPWVTFACRAALLGIDPESLMAARVGGGRGMVWRSVLWPRLLPAIGVGALLAFTWTAADLGVVGLLGVRTAPAMIEEAFGGWGDLRAGAEWSLLPVALAVLLSLLLATMGRPRPGSHGARPVRLDGPGSVRDAIPRSLAALGVGVGVLALLLTVGVPVASLMRDALPDWQFQLLRVPTHRRALGVTLLLASLSALACPLVALVLARAHGRAGRVTGRGATATLVLAFAFTIPSTIVGMGLIRMAGNDVVELIWRGPWPVVWADVIRFTFLAWVVLWPAWQGVDPSLDEAARLAPLPRVRRWITVLAPPLLRPVGLAAVLTGCAAAGELGATSLLRLPGYDTVPLVCYRLLHYGYTPGLAALSLASAGLALLVVPVVAVMGKRC